VEVLACINSQRGAERGAHHIHTRFETNFRDTMTDDTLEPLNTWPSSRTESATTTTQKLGPELLIGSNIFRNTNGVVKIHGKEQLVLESRPEQGLLLVTIDLYDTSGTQIAHVRRNELAINRAARFTIDVHRATTDMPSDAPWVRLYDQQSGEIAFEARVVSDHRIQITLGRFHSHTGALVDITPHYCRIGSGRTLFGDVVESRGGTVVLG
jgi:hypothetical protein